MSLKTVSGSSTLALAPLRMRRAVKLNTSAGIKDRRALISSLDKGVIVHHQLAGLSSRSLQINRPGASVIGRCKASGGHHPGEVKTHPILVVDGDPSSSASSAIQAVSSTGRDLPGAGQSPAARA